MSEQQRSQRVLGTFAAGIVIGIVEVVLAIAFATLVFGGRIESHLSGGIGLYLVAAALALGLLAWRGGTRGVVGSVQDAAASRSHLAVPEPGLAGAVTATAQGRW